MSELTTGKITTQVMKLSYEKAVAAVRSLNVSAVISDEQKAEARRALAEHPDNPANKANKANKAASNGKGEGSGKGNSPTRAEREAARLARQAQVDANKEEILRKLKAGEIDVEAASTALSALEPPPAGTLYCKVSEKGGLSVYGLQRMPVTLYTEQWTRLLSFAEKSRPSSARTTPR